MMRAAGADVDNRLIDLSKMAPVSQCGLRLFHVPIGAPLQFTSIDLRTRAWQTVQIRPMSIRRTTGKVAVCRLAKERFRIVIEYSKKGVLVNWLVVDCSEDKGILKIDSQEKLYAKRPSFRSQGRYGIDVEPGDFGRRILSAVSSERKALVVWNSRYGPFRLPSALESEVICPQKEEDTDWRMVLPDGTIPDCSESKAEPVTDGTTVCLFGGFKTKKSQRYSTERERTVTEWTSYREIIVFTPAAGIKLSFSHPWTSGVDDLGEQSMGGGLLALRTPYSCVIAIYDLSRPTDGCLPVCKRPALNLRGGLLPAHQDALLKTQIGSYDVGIWHAEEGRLTLLRRDEGKKFLQRELPVPPDLAGQLNRNFTATEKFSYDRGRQSNWGYGDFRIYSEATTLTFLSDDECWMIDLSPYPLVPLKLSNRFLKLDLEETLHLCSAADQPS